MKKFLVVMFLLIGCTQPNSAKRAAETMGWTDVSVDSSSYVITWGCQGGEARFEISGKNPAGKPASGFVCCARTDMPWSKGCTVRSK